jgi:hypothetical protein
MLPHSFIDLFAKPDRKDKGNATSLAKKEKGMKKLLIVLMLAMSSVPTLMRADSCFTKMCSEDNNGCCDESCECMVTSRSFLSVRPFFEAASPAKIAIVRKEIQEMRTHNGSLLQIVPFGGKSVKPERLAKYFGPSCKRVLRVAEDPALNPDILANQLNIYTQNGDFQSLFCLNPEQTFAGVGINYRTHFGYKDQNKGFFLDVTIPVYYVRNLMRLQEDILNTGGGPLNSSVVGSVTQAFKQPSWCYGRIDDCYDTKHIGLSEIDIQLGYGWGREQAFMHSYVGVLIPTGNKVKGRKVFEPIIGWDHHAGVHFGSNFGIQVWKSECGEHSIWYELAIDSRYLFENKQVRSFDLKNKPWSRYMMVYSDLTQAEEAATLCPAEEGIILGTPGINIFTQLVKVSPRFQRTYNTAFALDLKAWTLEGGYNFFARDAECVRLACPWTQVTSGPALKSLLGCGQTDDVQQIGNNYNNANVKPLADYASNIITEDQLDFTSASSPASLNHRLYGSIGYGHTHQRGYRSIYAFGFEYEFIGDNTNMNRWGAWIKGAVVF